MASLAPVLIITDPEKPFIVASDASIHSGSAVLLQLGYDGLCYPVRFFSRKWTQSEMKWATLDKEDRAMLDAICHWDIFSRADSSPWRETT